MSNPSVICTVKTYVNRSTFWSFISALIMLIPLWICGVWRIVFIVKKTIGVHSNSQSWHLYTHCRYNRCRCVATYIVAPTYIVAGSNLYQYSRHILSSWSIYLSTTTIYADVDTFFRLMGRQYDRCRYIFSG